MKYLPSQYLLFLVMLFGTLLTVTAQQSSNRYYRSGESFRQQNQHRDAIRMYEVAIKQEPENHLFHYQKGKSELRLKRYHQAKQSLKAATKIKPDFVPAHVLLAKTLKSQKDYENAIYHYRVAAKHEKGPSRQAHYLLLAVNLMMRRGNAVEAAPLLQEAQKLDAENPYVYFYRAELAGDNNDWQQAAANYERALETERLKNAKPAEKAKYFYGLGVAYKQLGDPSKAKLVWESAMHGKYKSLITQQSVEPAPHQKHYKIALGYYLSGAYEESKRYLSKAREAKEDFSDIYILLARIEQKQGSLTRAIRYYEQALSYASSGELKARIFPVMMDLQVKNKDYDGALNTYQASMNAGSSANETLSLLKAQSALALEKYSLAIETLEPLIEKSTNLKKRTQYYFLLGRAAKGANDLEKAKQAFQQALKGPFRLAAKQELAQLN